MYFLWRFEIDFIISYYDIRSLDFFHFQFPMSVGFKNVFLRQQMISDNITFIYYLNIVSSYFCKIAKLYLNT